MKLDLKPSEAHYVVPTFGDDSKPVDPALAQRLRRPMIIGAIVIAVMVVGLIVWASFVQLGTGVTAPGEVRVESNHKSIRHREGGVVKEIRVREGQRVTQGQPLIIFNDVEARASYDVFRNQTDSLLVQTAKFTAEAYDRPALVIEPALAARAADPQVAELIRDQQYEFLTKKQLFDGQLAVLNQRLEQIQTQIGGQQMQLAALEEQRALTKDEMAGYQTLYEKGYAPRQLILRYERQMAEMNGRRGLLAAEIARLRQQMGETRLQMGSLRNQRQSEAAQGLREANTRMADTLPRLTAATQTLNNTVVRSPVDGYVFNLTQFTVGGVTAAGELLMDIVPENAPLIIGAIIRPDDIDQVKVGMDAKVRITSFNPKWHDPLDAKVILVSPDANFNEKTGQPFYRAEVRIDPQELTKLKGDSQITPGMLAQVMFVTGERSLMSSLISPITDTLRQALREE